MKHLISISNTRIKRQEIPYFNFISMTKIFAAFSFILLVFLSCSAQRAIMETDSNIKKIKLGMSKQEVINTMGKQYRVAGADRLNDNSIMELITYENPYNEEYQLWFQNDVLMKWNRIYKYNYSHDRSRRDTIH